MEMKSSYLGLELKNPLIAAASPLNMSLDSVRRTIDHGAAAIVMPSLFEEQIQADAQELDHYLAHGSHSYAEAVSYFPGQEEYQLGPENYLEALRKLKESVDVPVIAQSRRTEVGVTT